MKQIAKNEIGLSGYLNLVESIMNVRTVNKQHDKHMAAITLIRYLEKKIIRSNLKWNSLNVPQYDTILVIEK